MFAFLLSILYQVADKQLGVLSLSAFLGALGSAFELALSASDSTSNHHQIGIHVSSQLLFSLSNVLLTWWLFLFCSATGAWKPLNSVNNGIRGRQDELERADDEDIVDERRTTIHSTEEPFSCFKTSRPRQSQHYILSLGPRRSFLSFTLLSALALFLLFIFGVLTLSWRITSLFQSGAGIALMRSCQVFSILILILNSGILIRGLRQEDEGLEASDSSSPFLLVLGLIGNALGFGEWFTRSLLKILI